MRTLCDSICIDNTTVDIHSHSNICICNFIKITGCDFNYSAPATTHKLLQSNYTLCQHILPTPIGMNLTLVRKLLQHDKLCQLLKWVQNNGQRTLTTIHHDADEIHCILERVKKDGGKLPLYGQQQQLKLCNLMLHPIVVLLIFVVLCLLLTLCLYIKLWHLTYNSCEWTCWC